MVDSRTCLHSLCLEYEIDRENNVRDCIENSVIYKSRRNPVIFIYGMINNPI